MRTVNILCVGNQKEAYWRDACAEYAKRLSRFCKFHITEVGESRLPDAPAPAEIDRAVTEEGERLIRELEKGAGGGLVVALCIEGRTMSSEQLADTLAQAAVNGYSRADFLIGGSYGLSSAAKARAALRLSFSPMTFPHQLARVMLCEQIYRAFCITAGTRYHK